MRTASSFLLVWAMGHALPALHAQSAPTMGAFQFSDGVHATFEATFPGAETRTVESFWKSELKSISVKVTDKKEMIGQAARIPSATADTLRILIKVERPKGATNVIAHIAFLTTSGYVAPDSPKRILDGCTAWVQQRSATLQRQVAQQALEDGQREMGRQQGRLADLKREKKRAENGLLKAAQKSEEAMKDKAAAEAELEQRDADRPLATDSAAVAKAEGDREKQRNKLQDRIKRLTRTIDSAKKKTDDLNWAIKQNVQDQSAQQQVVDKQQAVVNALQEKLQAIH